MVKCKIFRINNVSYLNFAHLETELSNLFLPGFSINAKLSSLLLIWLSCKGFFSELENLLASGTFGLKIISVKLSLKVKHEAKAS